MATSSDKGRKAKKLPVSAKIQMEKERFSIFFCFSSNENNHNRRVLVIAKTVRFN